VIHLAKNNTIGTILVSVFITLLLVGVGGYFGLPALFPNLNEDLTAEGDILQTKYNEWETAASVFWTDNIYEKMPDTELNITTNGDSKLIVAFEGAFMLRLGSTFSGYTKYNITLDISGETNRTTAIYSGIDVALGTDWEIPCNTHISFETGVLPAGTYTISIYWSSAVAPSAGWSQLFVLDEYPRSIYVQEIAG